LKQIKIKIKGDTMSLMNKSKLIKFFSSQYENALHKMFTALASAPTRPGWDPVFREKTPSQRQVLQQWSTVFSTIKVMARSNGIDFDNPAELMLKDLPEEKNEVEEIFDGE